MPLPLFSLPLPPLGFTATLAQFGLPGQGAPPPLPPSPFLHRLFLENPWPVVLAALAIGLTAAFLLNRAGKARQAAIAAGVALAVAAGVYGLAAAVETPRETLVRQSIELVRAVARADAAAVDALLAPDVILNIPPLGGVHDREAILGRIRNEMAGAYRVREHAVLDAQASIDGPSAGRTQVHVRVTLEAYAAPTFSWWQLDWRRNADGTWRVWGIRPLDMGGGRRR